MDHPRPSVITALFWAYWDLGLVLRKAWRPALFAFLVLSFGSFAALVAPRLMTYDPAGQAVMRLAILVGLCFLLTPFFLAVHRFLLLGEETTRYDFKPSSARFQLFFGWLAVGIVLMSFPSTLSAFAEAKGPVYYFGRPPPDLDLMIVTVARIVVLVIITQLLVLFPAVAVDAPGAGWQNAFGDSRNHIWFVLAVTILPFIPIGMLAVAVAPLFRFSPGTLTGMIAGLAWFGAMLLVISTLGAVIASRLYQVIGDRLNTPLRYGLGKRGARNAPTLTRAMLVTRMTSGLDLAGSGLAIASCKTERAIAGAALHIWLSAPTEKFCLSIPHIHPLRILPSK